MIKKKTNKPFGENKMFVPKGFKVAKKVDGPKVKLLKSVKRQLEKLSLQRFTLQDVMSIIDKRIEKEKKTESYYKLPKL